jgi:cellulose synthase/poly-beta-1,6-N-acetylglucosamine synthase-like glycosyltransferase
VLTSSYVDFKKKNHSTKTPFISVLIPTHNDGDTIEESIKSVYNSYNQKNFEIIVVNDCSTDNTADILKKLSKKYKLKIVTNRVNMGKVASLNKISSMAKGDLILFLDSDTLLSKKALRIMIGDLENEDVAVSTCTYKPRNKGFWARMQELEYGMDGLIQTSHNLTSSLAIWGGCFLIKKEAFEEVGKFSKSMLTEDLNLAMHLVEAGWKVREGHCYVETYVPSKFRDFVKQKMRWNAGYGQCFVKHYKTILSHPIVLLFVLTYVSLTISFVFVTIKNITSLNYLFDWFAYFHKEGYSLFTSFGMAQINAGFSVIKNLALYFFYPLFSLPYVFVTMKSKKEWYKVFLIFPFSIIYIPVYGVLGIVGIAKGLWLGFTLKENQRGW